MSIKKTLRPKHQFLQDRAEEQAIEQGRRRRMIPWNGKDEPTFEVEIPWDGKE